MVAFLESASPGRVIVGLLSVHEPGGTALVGMPEASRIPVRRVQLPDGSRTTGILVGVRATSGQGWGRSSERQRRRRYERRQAPERAAGLVVRAQRLVEGRARAPSEPPGTPVGRPPHQHRHLARTPLAGRRAAARADPAHPVRAVLRALRLRRRRRGPRAAHRPPVALRLRRRPALGGPADRRPAQRVLAQRPDAGAARLPRHLARPLRGPRPHRADAALAGARARRARAPGVRARRRRAPRRPGSPSPSWTCWSPPR